MSSYTVTLVSVNKTPARAGMLVARVVADQGPDFAIAHVANSSTIAGLSTVLSSLVQRPGLLICSSQWTAEEQREANEIAREVNPGIKIVNIPPGLDSRAGGDAVVEFLNEAVRGSGIPLAA